MSIFSDILESKGGNYCHAVEVSNVYELEEFTRQLFGEFREKYNDQEILSFFNSLSVYYIGDSAKDEINVYNFNFDEFIEDLA